MHLLASVLPLLSVGIAAPPTGYSEQFEKIAVAASSFQTCEQLGYSVDRQGIASWTRAAKQNAVAAGASEDEARNKLQKVVRTEWKSVLDRHARAKIMQHSPKHVARNNRLWQSRCENLAEDPWSAPYFSADRG
ncbi:hypothetical protein GRI69_11145 [Erythrobacter vulgaris]|uniref:Uncharacterized protein n=1 Tax=Qipengyuania vulgaris TaxID=291985 RepID=A0A844XV18_9SPHN|nr:hypothetical protein [Qipengyuania vulgaris]MXO48812.1 hypothetical protein [Qipengyuania vulgaris]